MRTLVIGFVLAAGLALACTSDRSSPTGSEDLDPAALLVPERGCVPAGSPPGGIPAQLCALLPTPMDRAVVLRFQAIQRDFELGEVEKAQAATLGLVDFLARLNRFDELDDPNGDEPPRIARFLASLTNDLLAAVDFDVEEIPPDAYDEGFVGVVTGDDGGQAVAQNQFYGAQFPPGAFDGEVLVVLDPLPDDSDPLLTDVVQVPKYVVIQTVPVVEEFDQLVTVSACAITDGLTAEQEAALRLAHNVGDGVEILFELVDPPFQLDCEGLGEPEEGRGGGAVRRGGPGIERAKGIGGTVSSFSPFGAVIPGVAPATGTVQAFTSTTGRDLDPDGYLLALDGGEPRAIGLEGSLTFEEVVPGSHTLTLTGVAGNCSVEGANPRAVTVEAGQTVETTFEVTCRLAASGRVVFVSNRDGDPDIYSMNLDGSDVTQLTDDPSVDDFPDLSHDGTRIAFTSGRSGNGDVYAMDVDGSNLVNLTEGSQAFDGRPSWSDDGTQLCFESTRSGYDVFKMDADGGNVVRLTEFGGFFCDWSPAGGMIAFTNGSDFPLRDVFVMDEDGNGETNITNSPGIDDLPTWSPDGSKIVFDTSRDDGNLEIYVINPDGSNPANLTTDVGFDIHPQWSNDGSKILFQSVREGTGGSDIFVMDPDGTDQVNITNDPADDTF